MTKVCSANLLTRQQCLNIEIKNKLFTYTVNEIIIGVLMQIFYKDKNLRKICENIREADKKLGSECGQRLRSRMADLEAAADVTELVAGHPHPLRGNRMGQFALNLSGGKRLVFEPKHEPVPTTSDGATNWQQVTAIIVVFIGDYHD